MLKCWNALSRSINRFSNSCAPRRTISFYNSLIPSNYGGSVKVLLIAGGASILGFIITSKPHHIDLQRPMLSLLTKVQAKSSTSSMSDLSFSQMLTDKKGAIFHIVDVGDAVNKPTVRSGVLVDAKSGILLSDNFGEVGSKVKVKSVVQNEMKATVIAVDHYNQLSLLQLEQPLADIPPIPLSQSSCRLGQRVVSAAWFSKTGLSVCGSIVTKMTKKGAECILQSTNEHRGGALLNMDGELVGILGAMSSSANSGDMIGIAGNVHSVIVLSSITDFLKQYLPSHE